MLTAPRASEIRTRLKSLFARYGAGDDMPGSVLVEIKSLNDELEGATASLEEEHERKRWGEFERRMDTPAGPGFRHAGGGGGDSGGGVGGLWGLLSPKALGDAFVASKAFRDFDGHSSPTDTIELKTLLDTTGWAPESTRLPRVEPYPVAPLAVADVFAQGETNQASVPYMEETTYTNTAAEVAEGGEKPEATLAFEEKSAVVRCIAVFLPVTRALMDDVSAARSYIGSRLGYMVRARLDGQLLNGDAIAPNLRGILNFANIQNQTKGADPVPDAVQKAMTLIEVNADYDADTVILHPNDWRDIKLLRTADGEYIFGHPSQNAPPQMWGKRVVSTSRIAEGTGLVGAFRSAAQLFYRSALEIAVSDSHSDYFIKNKLAVRGEIRVALACFRPAAFASVTGI